MSGGRASAGNQKLDLKWGLRRARTQVGGHLTPLDSVSPSENQGHPISSSANL